MADERDGRNDFDFIIGRWNVHNRRLKERLVGSTEWEEFEATSVVQKVLDGAGHIDELTLHRDAGTMYGVTVRLYDPGTHQWKIYWADSVHGTLDVPMIGSFTEGRGEFYAQDTHNGKSIFNRFIWTVFTNDHCQWEQAFSTDGGKTWETNWTMECTRRNDAPETESDTVYLANNVQDGRRDFDFLIGSWKVHSHRLRERLKECTEWEDSKARMIVKPLLGGMGNFDEIEIDREAGLMRGMTVRLFNPTTLQWSIHWADTATGTLLAPMVGRFANGRGALYDRETINCLSLFTRFHWIVIDKNHSRWEQAFSPDGGVTWETNWVMENTRV